MNSVCETKSTSLLTSLSRSSWLFPLAWIPGLTVLILSFEPSITTGLGFRSRLLFWLFHVGLLVPLLLLLQAFVDNALSKRTLPTFMHYLTAAGAATIVFAPISLALDYVFQAEADLVGEPTITAILFDEIVSLFVPILGIWLLINGPKWQLLSVPMPITTTDAGNSRVQQTAALLNSAAMTEQERSFWSKIPAELGRDVVCLSSEQHYLHVRTTLGHCLILFPLSRAIEVLEAELQGVLIHRSHWVALSHVVRLEQTAGNARVSLSHGSVLPVSRRRLSRLKDLIGKEKNVSEHTIGQ